MNIDDVMAALDERHAVHGNGSEEKYCDCVELVIHGRRVAMPRFHDCEYVRQRFNVFNDLTRPSKLFA